MKQLFSLLLVSIVLAQPAFGSLIGDKELADAYDRNLNRAVHATVVMSAPVAAEKAGLITLGKIFGRIAAKTVLLCGEAASGGFAVGSAIGGVVADPPVSSNEFFTACGMTSEEISFLPEITDAPFLGTIPSYIVNAIPYTQLISSIPGIEILRQQALASGDAAESTRLAQVINQQIDDLLQVTPAVTQALNEMQSELPAFLSSYPNAMSLDAITALLDDVASQGLPPEERNAILLYGFTTEDIIGLETEIVGLTPSDININTVFSDLASSVTDLSGELQRYRVPEPSTMLLLAIGCLLLTAFRFDIHRKLV